MVMEVTQEKESEMDQAEEQRGDQARVEPVQDLRDDLGTSQEEAQGASAVVGEQQTRRERKEKQREPSQAETAAMIADQLGETEELVCAQILSVVQALGRTQSRKFLQESQQVEETGGMMVQDGSRRRTLGGIFFHLVYTKGRPKRGRLPKRSGTLDLERSAQKEATQEQPVVVIPFFWQDRIAAIEEAEQQKGSASVKVTVVGRPGKIVDRGQCIVTVMESNKVPALPKGLPTPPAGATKYVVYIASKQWKKVAESLNDPEDVLIVEGFPTMDEQTRSIAVFATNTTTKLLQKAQKEAQKAKSEGAPA